MDSHTCYLFLALETDFENRKVSAHSLQLMTDINPTMYNGGSGTFYIGPLAQVDAPISEACDRLQEFHEAFEKLKEFFCDASPLKNMWGNLDLLSSMIKYKLH